MGGLFGLDNVLNVKAVVAAFNAFNQEKALLRAFSVIVKTLWTFVSSSTAAGLSSLVVSPPQTPLVSIQLACWLPLIDVK